MTATRKRKDLTGWALQEPSGHLYPSFYTVGETRRDVAHPAPLAFLVFRAGAVQGALDGVEVARVVQLALQLKVPLIPYGNGSGVLGGAIPLGGEVMEATSALARRTGVDTRPGPAEPRIPLLGRFQTRETNVTEREQAVRRKWKKADAAHTSVQRLLKAGQKDRARQYAQEHRDELVQYVQLKETNGLLDEITELRRTISRSPWSAEQRRGALVQLNDRLSRVLARGEPQ